MKWIIFRWDKVIPRDYYLSATSPDCEGFLNLKTKPSMPWLCNLRCSLRFGQYPCCRWPCLWCWCRCNRGSQYSHFLSHRKYHRFWSWCRWKYRRGEIDLWSVVFVIVLNATGNLIFDGSRKEPGNLGGNLISNISWDMINVLGAIRLGRCAT